MKTKRAYDRSELTWVPYTCEEVTLVTEDHDEEDKSERIVMDFIASTERVSRSGHIIDFDGLGVKQFKKYAPILFDHNYGILPVGRALKVEKDATTRQTKIRVLFDSDDPFAMTLAKKYQTGFMKAVSVGVMVYEREDLTEADIKKSDFSSLPYGQRLTKTDLMELSLVTIPANVDAVKIVDQAVKSGVITSTEGQGWMDELQAAPAAEDEKEHTLQNVCTEIHGMTTQVLERMTELLAQRNGSNAPLSRQSKHYSQEVFNDSTLVNAVNETAAFMQSLRKERENEG